MRWQWAAFVMGARVLRCAFSYLENRFPIVYTLFVNVVDLYLFLHSGFHGFLYPLPCPPSLCISITIYIILYPMMWKCLNLSTIQNFKSWQRPRLCYTLCIISFEEFCMHFIQYIVLWKRSLTFNSRIYHLTNCFCTSYEIFRFKPLSIIIITIPVT